MKCWIWSYSKNTHLVARPFYHDSGLQLFHLSKLNEACRIEDDHADELFEKIQLLHGHLDIKNWHRTLIIVFILMMKIPFMWNRIGQQFISCTIVSVFKLKWKAIKSNVNCNIVLIPNYSQTGVFVFDLLESIEKMEITRFDLQKIHWSNLVIFCDICALNSLNYRTDTCTYGNIIFETQYETS